MIDKFFESIGSNIKNKTTNPFFGTLAIVWLIHNYHFIYTIFNFENETKLIDKLNVIDAFMTNPTFIYNLLDCVWVSLLVLIVSFILLNLSRLVSNIFENKVTPYVYKITDSKSIVLKTQYDSQKSELDALYNKYELLRLEKVKIQNEVEEIEKKYDILLLENQKSINSDAQVVNSSESTTIVKDELDASYQNILNHLLSYTQENVINLIQRIRSNKDVNIESGIFKYFALHGLVKFREANMAGNFYEFSPKGEKLIDKYLTML